MNFVSMYLEKINSGEISACTKIKKLYQREVNWIKEPSKDFYFDEERQDLSRFIERFCKNPKANGADSLSNYRTIQSEDTARIRGLEKALSTGGSGSGDIRARKNSKSTENGSSHTVLINSRQREKGAEIYTAQNKPTQAE